MIKEAVDLGKDINESFDADSGSVVEKIVFSNRLVLVLMTLVISAFMAYVVVDKLALSASYEKMMPQNHEYVVNYFEHSDELSGLGSALRVVVTNPNGNIFDAEYIVNGVSVF